jgi:hypothetical protein
MALINVKGGVSDANTAWLEGALSCSPTLIHRPSQFKTQENDINIGLNVSTACSGSRC